VLGVGDDAYVVPRGTLRIGVAGRLSAIDELYATDSTGNGSTTPTPLAAGIALDALGAAQIPAFRQLERDVQSLTGLTDFSLSLGATRASASSHVTTTALTLDFGLFPRLSLRVMAPYVVSRQSVSFDLPGGDDGANVGFNPALVAGAARDTNAALVTQLLGAGASLGGAVATCDANPGAAGCADLLARRAEALALIGASEEFASGVTTIYGTGEGTASTYVPLEGGDAQQAARDRVAALEAGYASFGLTDVIAVSGPSGSRVHPSYADAQSVMTDPAYGLQIDSVNSFVEHGHFGDVEVGAKLLLLDTFGGEARRLAPPGFGFRASVAGIFRLGTGQPGLPDDPLDLGRGSGQNDIEVQPAIDLVFGSRLWTSVVGRFGVQQPDQQLLRIPERPGQVLVPFYARQIVERKLGNYYAIEVTPRLGLGDYFAIAAQYSYAHKETDEFSGTFVLDSATTGFGDVTLDAATLNAGSERTEQRVGGGITYSTLAAVRRGRARLPLEITYQYVRTASGLGGRLPHQAVSQLEARVYTQLFGRGPR
jgi:hypothetical protein